MPSVPGGLPRQPWMRRRKKRETPAQLTGIPRPDLPTKYRITDSVELPGSELT